MAPAKLVAATVDRGYCLFPLLQGSWYNGDYPPSYKNQPKKIREKATEIANEVLKTTGNEGEAIATGLKQARLHFKKEREENSK
jgi:uncharacterized protein YdaT